MRAVVHSSMFISQVMFSGHIPDAWADCAFGLVVFMLGSVPNHGSVGVKVLMRVAWLAQMGLSWIGKG